MKKFFTKKLIVVVLLLLVAVGAGTYFLVFNKSNNDSGNKVITEIKVDNLLGYLGGESDYSKFNALVGMFDSSKYLLKNEAGLEPALIIFAPNNQAFEQEDMKPFDSMGAESREKIKLYHMAKIYPADSNSKADLELKEKQKIVTLGGRELLVAKDADMTTITDAKGRDAEVSTKYAVSSKGDRIYFIDKVLLLQ